MKRFYQFVQCSDRHGKFQCVVGLLALLLTIQCSSAHGTDPGHGDWHADSQNNSSVSTVSATTVGPASTEPSHHHGNENHATATATTASPEIPLITNETEARLFLEELNANATMACQNRAIKDWTYATNITLYNRQQAAEATVQFSKFWREMWGRLRRYKWQDFQDPFVKRQFQLLSVMGISVLPEFQLRRYNTLTRSMVTAYSTAKICDYKNKTRCTLALEPELTEILMKSRDPAELKHIWLQWREQTGKKIRGSFQEMVFLFNNAAKLNKFSDGAEYELRSYESTTFRRDIEDLWLQLKPFYQQLHAYVRSKLRTFYGAKLISANGSIPAHLLGNMWAQNWVNIMDIVKPYNKTSIDVTPAMEKKNMTPTDMAKTAEEFFTSLGLSAMPKSFWTGSVLEKPKDREIICHASAWDLCNGQDFWIKQCTRVNMEDLITLHHEMGHTQYQIQYKDQPKTFRDGANPGFHEAIGDLMALSVQTPHHLHQIGLLDHFDDDKEGHLNYLLSMALEKIPFLPFAYLMEQWRWSVYKNQTTSKTYNCDWWKLREQYQGIVPPETRSEDDFDPGAKFHVTTNSPYIQYFVSAIVQFQFHQALCQTAGQFDPHDKENKPLHKCDIYKSLEAGDKLKKMLQLGASKPWPDALEIVTGSRKLDATAILDYFHPLIKWLEAENNKTHEHVGWVPAKPQSSCKPSMTTSPTTHKNGAYTTLGSITILVMIVVGQWITFLTCI